MRGVDLKTSLQLLRYKILWKCVCAGWEDYVLGDIFLCFMESASSRAPLLYLFSDQNIGMDLNLLGLISVVL